MAKTAFLPDPDDAKKISAPIMSRSKNQIATAYAPGAFFTFEGGLGACIAVPDQSTEADDAPINEATKEQILMRVGEVWQSWFSRAYGLDTKERPIYPRQCLDPLLLEGSAVRPLGREHIAFVNPVRMGYAPAPLTFVCNHCGLFKGYRSVDDWSKDATHLSKLKCRSPKRAGRSCEWRQLDVIFVHWSGEWQPATPGMWEWADKEGKKRLSGETCTSCNGTEFLLNTYSPRIGEWYFQCANPSCGVQRRTWLQNDPFTTEVFRDTSGARVGERRMEPISYRASAAFYPQFEQFVVFTQQDQPLLELLQEGNSLVLGEFVASQYGYMGSAPSMADIEAMLKAGGHQGEWDSYALFDKMYQDAESKGDAVVAGLFAKEKAKKIETWFSGDPPLVPRPAELPSSLTIQMARRQEFTGRYDPFSLVVEHESLRRSKLSHTTAVGGRAPFVRLYHLDQDLAPKDAAAKAAQEAKTVSLMALLGLEEFGLIRGFELCRFTHGYTRVSAVPVMEKRKQNVPVRLNLFDDRKGKRPLYVVTQQNEAFYVRLKPECVYAWLKTLNLVDLPAWAPGDAVKFGGRILESAEPFGRFFEALRQGDARTYRYVYSLLHTYAHAFMKNIAEFSGLDLGSLGEYLFPADLAFVVYRNGTTMDLGNLSSLWRNENVRFLGQLLEAHTHRCNSGSLCDFNGGACPDCVMVPETSCVAQNRLLSRAVLMGGRAPTEDLTNKDNRISGYLEVVNAGISS